MTATNPLTMVVNVGDKAPSFTLVDIDLKMRSLDEFKGKKVVLSFFVAASSPVCTKKCVLFETLGIRYQN